MKVLILILLLSSCSLTNNLNRSPFGNGYQYVQGSDNYTYIEHLDHEKQLSIVSLFTIMPIVLFKIIVLL